MPLLKAHIPGVGISAKFVWELKYVRFQVNAPQLQQMCAMEVLSLCAAPSSRFIPPFSISD